MKKLTRLILENAAVCVVITAIALAVSAVPAQGHFYSGCLKRACKRHVVAPYNAHLNRMAFCESTNRWYLDGTYDGGLQFSPGTWGKTGSRFAFAYQASKLEQKYRATVWASRIGWAWHSTAGWPVCG